MFIPSLLLKQLYTVSSLENTDAGVRFSLKNRLSDAELTGLTNLRIDGEEIPLERVRLQLDEGTTLAPEAISPENPVPFPLRKVVHLIVDHPPLPPGKHTLELGFVSQPFGKLRFSVEDSIAEEPDDRPRIPRDPADDYAEEPIRARQQFVEQFTGKRLEHVPHYSFDPHITQGNIENFIGVAQIPIGIAGPIRVHGEHAQGDFLIPLATTEGTLVASYNRGIKVVNLSGGVKATVVADAMQRAPVFIFKDARQARDFVAWVQEHLEPIRREAEATSSVARLLYIDPYLSNRFAYLRFNYSTGDAAGQNMVGRATFAACSWILDNYPGIERFYLESNFATDKKASQVNIMRTRGKRVTAEAVLKRDVLVQHMRVEPESLYYHTNVATIGAFLSGANNNGAHSPNAITAMFIATGQDVANVAESSAGIVYTELTPEGDLYISLTIPSLIVATYGGGTGLATQRECLELLGCYGKGKVNKLAEIIAAVALAGEVSLGAAISALDWVSSHEEYGRNR
ncbi:MAG: hydroxymethylglutaryl-CoA reductase [Rhodothermaceae bacterium]|nr:MAG: hydroxymethylglutaryl-CoA reductase [Rhodothermaceae bacterium]